MIDASAPISPTPSSAVSFEKGRQIAKGALVCNGARRAPPEDVGGKPGFEEILKTPIFRGENGGR